MRGDANRIGIVRQPEREIEQRDAVFEKRSAAGLGSAKPPAVGRAFAAERARAEPTMRPNSPPWMNRASVWTSVR